MGLTAAELEALGAYDPAGPHAATYRELLEFLTTLGASADELVAYRDDLPGLAAVVTVRADKPLTVSETAKREGIAASPHPSGGIPGARA
jgi:hypothetical protein